jgi:hypothetical protein
MGRNLLRKRPSWTGKVPAASRERQIALRPNAQGCNGNIHTSRYYKATINDHCRITGLRVAVYLNLHRREIDEPNG